MEFKKKRMQGITQPGIASEQYGPMRRKIAAVRSFRANISNWHTCLARFVVGRYLWRGIEPPVWVTRSGHRIEGRRFDWYSIYECLIADVYRLRTLKGTNVKRFVDIGGNIGAFTIAMLEQFPSARGRAYEPIPDSYGAFVETMARNSIGDQVRASNAAVTGSEIGSVRLWYGTTAGGCTSMFAAGEDCWKEARAVTLSEVLAEEVEQVDLLKIDVEGAEYEIILNTAPERFSKVSRAVIEYHDVDGHSWRELVDHLAATHLKVARNENRLLWLGPWP